ncbi:insulinase family protein [bacterium]|nr:insulinase family protein [bacterium]
MKRIIPAVVIVLCFALSIAQGTEFFTFSQEPQLFRDLSASDMIKYPPVRMWTLDNGLKVMFWENHLTPVISMRVGVKTGSQYEGKFLGAGISHNLEHVVSGGTTSRMTEKDYNDYLASIGATSNAYTTRSITCYYITGPSKEFPGQLHALSDWVSKCAFDEKELVREKGVITQEIYKGLEEPSRVMSDLLYKTAFQVHSVRYPIIGYIENFLRISRDDLIEYYNSFYSPDNSILTIAGDATLEEAQAYVDSFFGDWERKTHLLTAVPPEPAQLTARYAEVTASVKTSNMRVMWRGAERGDNDGYALDILTDILAEGRTSRLYKRLVIEEKLCNSIYASHYNPTTQPPMFTIGIGDFDYKQRDSILKIIDEEIRAVCDKGVEKRELEREKKLLVKNLMFENETVEDQTSSMLYSCLYYNRPTALDFLVPKYMDVQLQDIKRAAKKYLLPQTMNVVIVKPPTEENIEEFAVKSEGKIEFTKHVLDNGLVIVAAENNSVPHFDVNIFFNAGLRYEPEGKTGVSNLLADYLMEGVKGYPSRDKLSEYIEWNGYDVETGGGNNSLSLDGTFLPMDLDAGIELLGKIAFEPVFPKESLERLKEKKLVSIQADANNWSREALYFYRKVYFGNHPYANNPSGTPETVASITRNDIIGFYNSYIQPGNCVIGISGPMPVDEIIFTLEKYFGKYDTKPVAFKKHAPPQMRDKPETHIKKTTRGQVTLMLGFPAPNIYEEDRYALAKMQGFLSGMKGRLHDELRGVRDLVYLVWGSNFLGPEGGTFYVMTQTSPENFDTVKAVILREIERIKKGDFGDREIEQAAASIHEGFYRGRQKQKNHVFSAALDELYGLGYEYDYKYLDNIDKVTKDDIVAFANKYLNNPIIAILAPEDFANSIK